MKIFALQTDVNEFRKQYIVEKEESELLLTHYHWIKFIMGCYREILITISLFSLFFWTTQLLPDFFELIGLILIAWLLFAVIRVAFAFINYRFSYILVTTEKVVVINHPSLFVQRVNPMPLSSIVSTDISSQLFGIFNCGLLVLNLSERTQYSSKQVELPYVPAANSVAGIIENGMTLEKNRIAYDGDLPTDVVDDIHQKADMVQAAEPLNQTDPQIDAEEYKDIEDPEEDNGTNALTDAYKN